MPQIHRILRLEHLSRPDSIEDLSLVFIQIGFEHLCRLLLGRSSGAGRGVRLDRNLFEFLQDFLLGGFIDGFEGLEAEVDGFADFFLGELAVDVGLALDDCFGGRWGQ